MKEFLDSMTDNMRRLYLDIMASLRNLPDEMKIYMFGEEGNEDMEWIIGLTNYIVFEYIKYSYDYSDPEYPLRHFVDYTNDSERMLQSRIVKYVMKYKKRDLDNLEFTNEKIEEKYRNIEMNSIEKRLSGYRLTEMNYFEHQNIHDLDLIKAIVERRIESSKKISNSRFEEIFCQYDDFVEQLIDRSKKSDEDMVFAQLAFFTLEWHYPVETFYYAACMLEDEEEVDYEYIKYVLLFLCGRVKLKSQFYGSVNADSRMVMERFIILSFIFNKNTDSFMKDIMLEMINEYIIVGVWYKENITSTGGGLYRDWFRKESNMKDWASFLKKYDFFNIWKRKEWTRKRIQIMRKLFELTSQPKL